jgi:hypothetical protein
MKDPQRSRLQRSAAILSVFSLAVLTAIQVFAAEAREYPVTVVKDLQRSSPAPSGPAQYIISVDGAQCTTMDEFRQAILRLPAGSRVTWEVGCFSYTKIPIGPAPQTPKREFQAWCAEHGVTFAMTKYTSY